MRDKRPQLNLQGLAPKPFESRVPEGGGYSWAALLSDHCCHKPLKFSRLEETGLILAPSLASLLFIGTGHDTG